MERNRKISLEILDKTTNLAETVLNNTLKKFRERRNSLEYYFGNFNIITDNSIFQHNVKELKNPKTEENEFFKNCKDLFRNTSFDNLNEEEDLILLNAKSFNKSGESDSRTNSYCSSFSEVEDKDDEEEDVITKFLDCI